MRITPLDIRKQEFKRGLRGYDPEEVQSFLQMVSTQWDELQAEHRRFEQKVSELEGKLQHYVRVEEALQEALRTARESSRQALEAAKQQAQTVLREAEHQAEQIRRGAEQESRALRREAADARSRRNEIIARLRAFLHAEMELLAHFDSDQVFDSEVIEAVQERPQARSGPSAAPRPEPPAPSWQEALPKPASQATSPFLDYDDLHDEPHPVASSYAEPTDDEEPAALDWSGVEMPALEERDASSSEFPEPAEESESKRDDARHNTGWVVRPVISAPAAAKPPAEETEEPLDEDEPQEKEEEKLNISASTDEIERIRRILKDLE